MFGGRRIRELEAQLSALQRKLDSCTKENEKLTQDFASAHGKASMLEAQLQDLERQRQENEKLTQALETERGKVSELETELSKFDDAKRLMKEAQDSKDEFEALKGLYMNKRQEFEDGMEEKEKAFAEETAQQRASLDKEIRDSRQANQEYVTSSVKTFAESYNYYLNQIKLLMDTLSDVAAQTSGNLFSGENGDLKARIGHQIRERLTSGTDALKGEGNVLLFASAKEDAEESCATTDAETPATPGEETIAATDAETPVTPVEETIAATGAETPATPGEETTAAPDEEASDQMKDEAPGTQDEEAPDQKKDEEPI